MGVTGMLWVFPNSFKIQCFSASAQGQQKTCSSRGRPVEAVEAKKENDA
jgi:hypothetical protein